VVTRQQVIDQGRLSGAQEARDDGDRQTIVFIAAAVLRSRRLLARRGRRGVGGGGRRWRRGFAHFGVVSKAV